MSRRTKIAGVTHKNYDGTSRQDILAEQKERLDKEFGRQLVLKSEPDNPVSSYAVAVYNNRGEQLGYLKDDLAFTIIDEIREIGMAYAEITDVTGGEDGKYYGCNIKIPFGDEEGNADYSHGDLIGVVVPEGFGEKKKQVGAQEDTTWGSFIITAILVFAFFVWLFYD